MLSGEEAWTSVKWLILTVCSLFAFMSVRLLFVADCLTFWLSFWSLHEKIIKKNKTKERLKIQNQSSSEGSSLIDQMMVLLWQHHNSNILQCLLRPPISFCLFLIIFFYFFYYIQLIAVYIVLFTIELASLSGKTGTRSVVCIWNIDLYKQIWLQLDEILKNYRCLTIKVATPTKVCQLITEKKF